MVEFDSSLTMHTLNNFACRLIDTGSVEWLQIAAKLGSLML